MKKLLSFCFAFLMLPFLLIFGGSVKNESVEIVLKCLDETVCWSDSLLDVKTTDYQFELQKRGFSMGHNYRANLVKKIVNMNFSYEQAFGYVFPGLDKKVNETVSKIDKSAIDASFRFQPNSKQKFVYSNERSGRYVNKEQLYKSLLKRLEKTGKIEMVITPTTILPKVTKKELISQTKLIATFETSYAKSSENRKQNIRLALNSLNGLVLKPNKVCSFNNITGKRTKERGYKEANIIINNEYVEGFGGGVCQVSSTLYNALLLADVCVVESHPHSLESSYVLSGFDSMVSFGVSDLKFVNKGENPLFVETYFSDEKIGVKIYGTSLPYKITRKNEVLKEIHPSEDVVIQDKTLLLGEKVYKTFPKVGKQVKSYLEYSKDGKVLKTTRLRVQTYKPIQGVLRVGTKIEEENNSQTFSNFKPLTQ